MGHFYYFLDDYVTFPLDKPTEFHLNRDIYLCLFLLPES